MRAKRCRILTYRNTLLNAIESMSMAQVGYRLTPGLGSYRLDKSMK